MQIITFVTIYAVLSQMTFLSQNTRFSRHFLVCYEAPITFNDVWFGDWAEVLGKVEMVLERRLRTG